MLHPGEYMCGIYGWVFFTAKSVVMGIFFMLYARVYKELIRKSSQNCQEWSKLSFIVKKLSETLINIQIVINMVKYRDNCGKMFVKICRYGPTTKKIWVGGWVFLSGPHIPTIFLDKYSPPKKSNFDFECSEILQNDKISNCSWVSNFTMAEKKTLNLNALKCSRMKKSFFLIFFWVDAFAWFQGNYELECSEMLHIDRISNCSFFLSQCFYQGWSRFWIFCIVLYCIFWQLLPNLKKLMGW